MTEKTDGLDPLILIRVGFRDDLLYCTLILAHLAHELDRVDLDLVALEIDDDVLAGVGAILDAAPCLLLVSGESGVEILPRLPSLSSIEASVLALSQEGSRSQR